MGGTDTPQKRKEIVEQEAAKLKALLFIPNEIQRNIHEGFDPILVTEEVVDNHFNRIFNFILDFDSNSKNDAQFIEETKDALAYFIGELIDELQDGFINGYSDVVVFFRENFKKLLAAGAGPEMGMFLGSFGTDQIMTYVTAG